MGEHELKVSVIATVKNEGSTITEMLTSLMKQTRVPDDVVIVDGGSLDDTVEQIKNFSKENQFPITVISEPEANISRGRNIAIKAAKYDFIASTDSGVQLSSIWLEELMRPYQELDNVQVVSGFFLPSPNANSVFETAMGATVLPVLKDIDPNKFLPSSRSVAFTKKAWREVGGYPEWLDYCEDLILDFAFKRCGFKFVFAPNAIAYFRPRTSLRSFFLQYYRYARGDGKADLFLKRHLIRYSTYTAGPILFVGGFYFNFLWLPLIVGGLLYTMTPYIRLIPMIKKYSLFQKLEAILWVPIIRFVGDIAKMAGYPVGVYWRLKNRVKN